MSRNISRYENNHLGDMKMLNALYILPEQYYDMIYGEEQREQIATLVNVKGRMTNDEVRADLSVLADDAKASGVAPATYVPSVSPARTRWVTSPRPTGPRRSRARERPG